MAKKQASAKPIQAKKTSIQSGILKVLSSHKYIDENEAKKLILEHFKRSEEPKNKRQPFTYSIQRSIDSLIANGDIAEITHSSNSADRIISLSEKGRQKLSSQSFDMATSLAPTIWDGKWRIVLLDFPEYQKQDRDTMRYLLKKARFVCLKKSVWISPYPYEEYIQSLKKSLPSSDAVICMVAEKIDNDVEQKLLEHFRLVRQ